MGGRSVREINDWLWIGELNEDGNLHDRGMHIDNSGNIHIGYFDNLNDAPGNFILILSDGKIDVGACFLGDGGTERRFNRYKIDGKVEWLTI